MPSARRAQRRPRQPDRPKRESPGYVPPELTPQQRAEKTRLLSRFRYFAERWQNWQGVFYYSQPHDEMCDELEEMTPVVGASDGQKKKIYLAPRYTYKTSLILAFMAYLFLKFREQGVDIAMDYVRATIDLAEEVLYELKGNLEQNPMILEYWGDLSKAAFLWSARKINFGHRRDATLSVLGLDKGASGKHPDIVFFDDIVNEKNYDSPIAKRKARTKINAYVPIIPPGWGVMVHAGTRFAFNDVSGWLLDQNETNRRRRDALLEEGKPEEAKEFEPKWKEYIRAYDDGPGGKGTPFFPARLPIETVLRLREDLDPRLWAAWYLNQCYAEGMRLFQPSYLKYFTGHYSPPSMDDRLVPTLEVHRIVNGKAHVVSARPVRVTMTIDPTTTAKARSDRTGMSIVAVDSSNDWWLMLARSFLEVPSVIGEKAVEYLREYVPSVLRIESAMADVDMVARIRDGITKHKLPTVIESYLSNRDEAAASIGRPSRRGKIARIEGLEPRFRNGSVWLRAGYCDDFIEQYLHWPDVEHDDVMDCVAMHYGLAKPSLWETVKDAELDLIDDEDEEQGDWHKQYSLVVRMANGQEMKITVDPFQPDSEPRLVGKAGVASQRLRLRSS